MHKLSLLSFPGFRRRTAGAFQRKTTTAENWHELWRFEQHIIKHLPEFLGDLPPFIRIRTDSHMEVMRNLFIANISGCLKWFSDFAIKSVIVVLKQAVVCWAMRDNNNRLLKVRVFKNNNNHSIIDFLLGYCKPIWVRKGGVVAHNKIN